MVNHLRIVLCHQGWFQCPRCHIWVHWYGQAVICEDLSQWRQGWVGAKSWKSVFVVACFVGNITWLSSTTHEHTIYTRERTSLGPWVTCTCSEVIVFFCTFIVGLSGALLMWPAIVIVYTEVISVVFDGSFVHSTEMGVASSLCM
jgi:hypothetical protein